MPSGLCCSRCCHRRRLVAVHVAGRCGPLVDGVRHRVRVGCPWRDVPDRYGPWWRVYGLFACWQLLGVWVRIEAALRARADSAGRLSWQVSVDSTISRAHIHAAGARRDSTNRVAGEPDHHALGRSRGGWGTKTHAVIDQHRGVLAFLLTPGQDGDSPQMIPVLEMIRVDRPGPGRPRRRPQRVLADKAYSSKANRAWLRAHRIPTTIPVPADQVGHRRRRGSRGGRPPAFDPDTYKDRHAVECGFNILKHPPRIRHPLRQARRPLRRNRPRRQHRPLAQRLT
jgi:transposase